MEKQKNIPSKKDSDSLTISILGPPRVGKTTLLKSLLLNFGYSENILPESPVTIFTKDKVKILLMEGPPNPFCLINLIKVTDVILLLIDGFFGLELETFEIISLARINGIKKIFFLVTHLDFCKKWKTLKTTKKRIKDRLSKEMNKQSKFFFLSGITLKETYFSKEILNITRFLKNFTSLNFHPNPHVVVSRIYFRRRKKKIQTICVGHLQGKPTDKIDFTLSFIPGLGFIKIRKISSFFSNKTFNHYLTNSLSTLENPEKEVGFSDIFKKNLFFQKGSYNLKEKDFLFYLTNLEIREKKKKTSFPLVFFFVDSNKFRNLSMPDVYGYPKKKSLISFFSKRGQFKFKVNEKRIFDSKKQTSRDFLREETDKSRIIAIDIGEFPLMFKKYFDSAFPLIFSFSSFFQRRKILLKAKIKRHRWNNASLYSGGLYDISLNWQLFKTRVYLCQEHSNKDRLILRRSLKTNSTSGIIFYSFPETPKTPIVGINWDNFYPKYQLQGCFFGVIFSGFILKEKKDWGIFKKIKLKGQIYKHFKKTAFIKEMFSSEIQAIRFQGSLIERQNGERGVIKKAVTNGPKGAIRVTFEKEIQKKGDAFMKIWVPIRLEKVYYPIDFFWVASDFQEIQGNYLFLSPNQSGWKFTKLFHKNLKKKRVR